MYDAIEDPYCYPGTTVLRNKRNLRIQSELDKFEALMTTERAQEPLPTGRLDYIHYRAIHRHLFQDVYEWAGRIRTVRMTKDGSPFCYPENIDREMRKIFGTLEADNRFRDLTREAFAAKAGRFLADLNAIHPFREGNGRTQTSFLLILADQAGHPLDFERLNPGAMLRAMIESFQGDERPLVKLLLQIMRGG
jgi:cell filamentation protein